MFYNFSTSTCLTICLLLVLVINACGQKQEEITPKNEKMEIINKTDDEWRKELTEQQYYVLRKAGTEAPFTGKLLLNKEKGIYTCAGCGNHLFTDEMKFDSHCGWPSFDREIAGGKIKTYNDLSHGMQRTEIVCAKCGGHLGHIFNDGPTETGMRYCVNSISLDFIPASTINSEIAENKSIDTITLGGGCYWCVEAIYQKLKGVLKVESGFSGGTTINPTYKEVCSEKTGHAEVVQITYNTSETSLEEILKVFFTVHDPTTLNKQGNDIGTQYRSVIFYRNEEQKKIVKLIIDELNKEKVYDKPIVTQISEFTKFYKAEEYHQNYYNQNKEQGYCRMVIQPKIEKFEKVFKGRIK